jgi:hypothetical protein
MQVVKIPIIPSNFEIEANCVLEPGWREPMMAAGDVVHLIGLSQGTSRQLT